MPKSLLCVLFWVVFSSALPKCRYQILHGCILRAKLRFAYCPTLPGCHSQGDTFEESLANIKEAVEFYLETMTPEEITEALSQEILTTTMEIQVA